MTSDKHLLINPVAGSVIQKLYSPHFLPSPPSPPTSWAGPLVPLVSPGRPSGPQGSELWLAGEWPTGCHTPDPPHWPGVSGAWPSSACATQPDHWPVHFPPALQAVFPGVTKETTRILPRVAKATSSLRSSPPASSPWVCRTRSKRVTDQQEMGPGSWCTQVEAALACPGQCPAPVLLPPASSSSVIALVVPRPPPSLALIYSQSLDLNVHILELDACHPRGSGRRKSQYAEIPLKANFLPHGLWCSR